MRELDAKVILFYDAVDEQVLPALPHLGLPATEEGVVAELNKILLTITSDLTEEALLTELNAELNSDKMRELVGCSTDLFDLTNFDFYAVLCEDSTTHAVMLTPASEEIARNVNVFKHILGLIKRPVMAGVAVGSPLFKETYPDIRTTLDDYLHYIVNNESIEGCDMFYRYDLLTPDKK